MILTSIFNPVIKPSDRVKLHPSVQLTLILFAFMLTIGVVSGVIGFTLGRQSLKGVTQPAINPFLNNESESVSQRPRQGVSFLKERDILAKVKSQTSGTDKKNATKPKQKPEKKPDKADEPQLPKSKNKPKATKTTNPQAFPIKAQEKSVQLEVRSVTQTEDSLLLNVALKNNGSKPVQFIYTFLEIEDNQGQSLLSDVRGLPTELKPSSDNYFGTVEILDVLPESVEQVSLTLTDYPDQTITLQVSDIPVS